MFERPLDTAAPSIWRNPRRGFRMMWWDPIAGAVCVAAVWASWDVLGSWGLIAPYVLGTFFLFCNVFRVRRNAELLWAGTFLLNAVLWLQFAPSLVGIFAVQSVITAAVIACEFRAPGYRGVFSDATITPMPDTVVGPPAGSGAFGGVDFAHALSSNAATRKVSGS